MQCVIFALGTFKEALSAEVVIDNIEDRKQCCKVYKAHHCQSLTLPVSGMSKQLDTLRWDQLLLTADPRYQWYFWAPRRQGVYPHLLGESRQLFDTLIFEANGDAASDQLMLAGTEFACLCLLAWSSITILPLDIYASMVGMLYGIITLSLTNCKLSIFNTNGWWRLQKNIHGAGRLDSPWCPAQKEEVNTWCHRRANPTGAFILIWLLVWTSLLNVTTRLVRQLMPDLDVVERFWTVPAPRRSRKETRSSNLWEKAFIRHTFSHLWTMWRVNDYPFLALNHKEYAGLIYMKFTVQEFRQLSCDNRRICHLHGQVVTPGTCWKQSICTTVAALGRIEGYMPVTV